MYDYKEDYASDMYYEDGEFKPLTASHGNINGKLAHLRNTYMTAEREYFEELLKDDKLYEKFETYLNYSADELFDCATTLHEKLEYGEIETPEELEQMKKMTPEERDEYHLRNLEAAEGLMCLLYAAARDKALILEYVLRPGYSRGR